MTSARSFDHDAKRARTFSAQGKTVTRKERRMVDRRRDSKPPITPSVCDFLTRWRAATDCSKNPFGATCPGRTNQLGETQWLNTLKSKKQSECRDCAWC
jgi:hypothetical protein